LRASSRSVMVRPRLRATSRLARGAAEAGVSEELEVLKTVGRRLDALGIPYMVTGSMAVSYYGVPPVAPDIDIVIDPAGADAERLCEAFEDGFYVDSTAVRRAVEERGLFNLIHLGSVMKVDFVVRKETEYRREEFARRRRIRVEGQELSLVMPEDLVIS